MCCGKMVMNWIELFADVDNHAKNICFSETETETKYCLGKDLSRLYKDLNVNPYYDIGLSIGYTNEFESIYLVTVPKNCNIDYIW